MHTSIKWLVAATAAIASIAGAQTATTTRAQDGRTVGEATRDGINAVGRAASAAVTPGDQNMGRNPDNRSGGLMGNDRSSSGSDTTGRRAARADRG